MLVVELETKTYPNKALQGNKSTCLVSKSLKLMQSTVLTNATKKMRPLVAGFPLWWPGFGPRSGHVEFVVAKMALGQVSSKHIGCPCQFSSHLLLHTHHHLSSRAGTVGQRVACILSGLIVTPTQEKEKS
jgi:hypothetical protein